MARRRRARLILIADDSRDTRQLYAAYLIHRGFAVVTAADGDTAIDLAVRLRPDLIVMDLAMPRLDGLNATQRLKLHPRTSRVPVIVLTGYPYAAIERGAFEAGADVFLTKPCLPDELERHALQLLGPTPDAR
jgi:CheY-like chemotaxis protein